jgi:hypothetical protein
MTVAQFEEISLFLGVGGLILYMIFVMYKLAEPSGYAFAPIRFTATN